MQVNKKFDARAMCEGRTYEYYLPASLIGEQVFTCVCVPVGGRRASAFTLITLCFEHGSKHGHEGAYKCARRSAHTHRSPPHAGLKGDGSEADAAALAAFRAALRLYVGNHAFHNFTKRTK